MEALDFRVTMHDMQDEKYYSGEILRILWLFKELRFSEYCRNYRKCTVK